MAGFKNYFAIVILFFVLKINLLGQFSPQAGLPGSSAIPADDPEIHFWATHVSVERGYLKLSDTEYTISGSNRVSFGTTENALGVADNKVVSLGDGGVAVVSFDVDVSDGAGWDFVVFENGFRSLNDSNLAFLELAFVEVSSDGKHFFRFPPVSLTQDSVQVGGFDFIDARRIHNLAGKYIAGYGTPFDLADLQEINSPYLDLQHVKFIKIIDVVGSINPNFARYDSQGHIINDPFPTPYPSGGFDLDAIGIKNFSTPLKDKVKLFPDPVINFLNIISSSPITQVDIYNISGQKIFSNKINNNNFVQIFSKNWSSGLYFCLVFTKDRIYKIKFIKI